MAVNWVMLSNDQQHGFINLPNEKTLYISPPRTALSIQTLKRYPGNQPLSIQSSAGCVYLTNQRIVYLPASPTPQLQSFSAPLLNLHDSHVTAPFFGPNVWTAALQPVVGGGIPPVHAVIELKMTFKEGGAFDFHSQFERIKERVQQAVETARESGLVIEGEDMGGRGGGPLAAIDLTTVHLDELPAYDGPSTSNVLPFTAAPVPLSPTEQPISTRGHPQRDSNIPLPADGNARNRPTSSGRSSDERFEAPAGPPPGYEEVQQLSIADELERHLRRSSES